jgi:CubicO group peptidase (beta-lactamase class C family)
VKLRLRILLLAGVFAMLNQGCASVKDERETAQWPRNEQIDNAMRGFVAEGELSGVVTVVADRNGIEHLSAMGERNLAEHLPMRTDTIFWAASMTKPVTATAIMMLQEEGKLSIDDPVAKYIPEFAALKTPSGKPANLTLRHLLTHTSGLAESPEVKRRAARNLEELMPTFLDEPMHFEPGTKWTYCQSGINTLGRIIEVVSGQSYQDFLQARIFDPLGMKDSTFYPTPEQIRRLAVSYVLKDRKLTPTTIKLLPGPVGDRNHYAAPNGGLFTTAADYSRFARMLLNNGTLDGVTILSPQSVKEMTRIQTDDLPKVGFIPGSSWGLGVGIVRESVGMTAMLSAGTFGHGGAYGTQVWIDPVKGKIYILLIQRGDIENSDNSVYREKFQEAATF